MKWSVLFSIVVIALVASDHVSQVTLSNPLSTKEYYGVLYSSKDAWRLNVAVTPIAMETILQRRNLVSPAYLSGKSTQLVFSSGKSGCCQHEVVKYTEISSPTAGSAFSISRKDGYNTITVKSVEFVANATSEILEDAPVLDEECPVSCSLDGDFVILVDGSSSIDTSPIKSNGTNFREMREFIRAFSKRFTISKNSFHLGLTYFAGYGQCSSNSCRRDDFCLPISGATREEVFDIWNGSSSDWIHSSGLNFFTSNTSSSSYSCWNGTTQNKGYASVELYISDNPIHVDIAIDRLNNYRAYDDRPRIEFTSIGSGIELSRQLFNRKPSPRGNATNVLLVLTDGRQNAGEPYLEAATRARAEGIDIYIVGFGDSIDYDQLVAIAGNESHVIKANFTQAFGVLNELIVGVCTVSSTVTGDCPDECVSNTELCTACGNCSLCDSDDECVGCMFCDDVLSTTSRCVNDTSTATAVCMSATSPNECEKSVCVFGAQRNVMCEVVPNVESIAILEEACVSGEKDGDYVFLAGECKCSHTPPPGGDFPVIPFSAGAAATLCLCALATCCLFFCALSALMCMSMFCASMIPPHLLPFLSIPLAMMGKKADIVPLMTEVDDFGVVEDNPLYVDQDTEHVNPLHDL